MDNYLNEMWEWRLRAERAERLLQDQYTLQEINKAHQIRDLEEKNRRLKDEVRRMQLKAEVFNKKLYATGLIVNCTGCIPGAPDNYKELTEDKVKCVEEIAQRLRIWWENNKHKIERE